MNALDHLGMIIGAVLCLVIAIMVIGLVENVWRSKHPLPLCAQTRWQLRLRRLTRRGDAICGHDRCHEAIRADQAQRIQPPPPPLPLPVSVGEISYQRRRMGR